MNLEGFLSPMYSVPMLDDFAKDKKTENMSRHKISIIVAVFNGAATLVRCIDSVISQTEADIELIIIDGGSTDGTVEIIRSYADRLAYWESESDKGIADAWNKAIKHAKGEWLYFLGTDDILASPNVLSDVMQKLDVRCGLVAYGCVTYINSGGHAVMSVGEAWDPDSFRRYGMSFSHQGVFQHYRLFEEYGLFDISFQFAADYELLLRYLKNKDAFYLGEIEIARVGLDGISSKDALMLEVFQEYRISQAMNGLSGNSLRFSRKFAGAVVKRVLILLVGNKIGRRWIDVIRSFVGRPRRGS